MDEIDTCLKLSVRLYRDTRMNTLGTCRAFGPILNAIYFRRGLMCTLGLTNDLIDGDQPRAKTQFLKCDLASLGLDGV